jgi:hypothetical protein
MAIAELARDLGQGPVVKKDRSECLEAPMQC